jgi:putative intracellular protease/amidase
MMKEEKKLQVAILLYDDVTALDAIDPYEVLQSPMLGIDVRFVAREKGMKRTDFGRLDLMADYTLDETPGPDILLVPGTPYPHTVMGDHRTLNGSHRYTRPPSGQHQYVLVRWALQPPAYSKA